LALAENRQSSNLVTGAPDDACRTASVAFGQPAVDDVLASGSLRWVHLSSAGYTRFDRPEIRQALRERGTALTTSSGVYANPCAQHVLAFMLAHSRRLSPALDAQRNGHRWAYGVLRASTRLIECDRVLLVGYGAIARRLVTLLAPFNVTVAAIRRSVRGDEAAPTFPLSRLDELLPEADHVVNLLPSAPGNERLFDAARFARMKRSAAFYNVGRGDTVDQTALAQALHDGRLGGAYLDVTTPEPLPPHERLWDAPNCYITPHIAGGAQDEAARLVDHFVGNLARFISGDTLLDRVI
jgi:phosphoglycerate dehydrogenase-like enzyme